MDLITLNRIKLLHPKIRQEVLNAYTHINKRLLGKGLRLRFAYTLRSFRDQDDLYALGRSTKTDANGRPLTIVTNAKAGQSIHNYGLAFDIVLLADKNGDGTFEAACWNIKSDDDKDGVADWMEVIDHFKKSGWTWGGDWKSFPDYPHLEKTFGHNWRTLQAKYNAADVFTEIIDGKTYKWVNL